MFACPHKDTLMEPVNDSHAAPTAEDFIAVTRSWVEKAVIGLNLCPFAKAVQVKGLIRYVVSLAQTPEALLEALMRELELLAQSDPEKSIPRC